MDESREAFDLIKFIARACEVALAWTTTVEPGLNLCDVNAMARRAAIDDDADSAPVRFPKRRDAVSMSKGVSHNRFPRLARAVIGA
jgi:hypothetical protein